MNAHPRLVCIILYALSDQNSLNTLSNNLQAMTVNVDLAMKV